MKRMCSFPPKHRVFALKKGKQYILGDPITPKHFSDYALQKENEFKSLIESGKYFGEFKTLFALESED